MAVGRVLGAWGVHGAVRLESLTDFPDRFAVGARLWIDGEVRIVEHCHWRRGTPIVQLSGIDDPGVARALRGSLVELPEAELHPLGEDEYYQHDLIGLVVTTSSGAEIGRVVSLVPTGANDVLAVEGEAGQYLLPLIEDVVRRVDLSGGTIVVELLDGLAPQPARAFAGTRPPSRRRRPPASPKQAGNP